MFSLCIPTMNRFDTFLGKNLHEYLKNDLISEIIICDETGDDMDKILVEFNSSIITGKMKVFKNEKRLGPFLNKLKCCRLASNTWIALIDSDNFADETYFKVAKKFLESNTVSQNSILAPSVAAPHFDFNYLGNMIYSKNTFRDNLLFEQRTPHKFNSSSEVFMNVGNYIINKYLIDNLNTDNESINSTLQKL